MTPLQPVPPTLHKRANLKTPGRNAPAFRALAQFLLLALPAFSFAATSVPTTLLAQAQGAAPAKPPGLTLADEPDEFALPVISDPLESFNRAVFQFNDGFYTYLLRPVAHGYEKSVPEPARHGLANFFENLKFPVRLVGNLLAGRPTRAVQETGKFVLNTTVGFAGLIKVSDTVPALAAVPDAGLGTAFAAWGFGPGPYLVLPFFGPDDIRDTIAFVGDYYLIPYNWDAFENVRGYQWEWPPVLNTLDAIQDSPATLRQYDDFLKSAVDPYVGVRNAYLQYRANAVKK